MFNLFFALEWWHAHTRTHSHRRSNKRTIPDEAVTTKLRKLAQLNQERIDRFQNALMHPSRLHNRGGGGGYKVLREASELRRISNMLRLKVGYQLLDK